MSLVRMSVYRADAATRFVGMVIMVCFMVVVLSIPFRFTNSLVGWTQGGVMVVLGMYYMSNGLSWTFFRRGLGQMESYFRTGVIDVMVIRPVDALFSVAFSDIDPVRVMDVIVGLSLILWQIIGGSIHVTVVSAAGSFAALIAGVIVLFSMSTIVNTLSFWVPDSFLDHVVNPVFALGKYPVTLWGPQIASILFWIVPIGFMSTVPSGVLVGSLHGWWVPAGICIAGVWLVFARMFWIYTLHRYVGSGRMQGGM